MSEVTTTQSGTGNGEYKTHALISYILFIVGLFTAVPVILGALWAMINKRGALSTPYHSHFVNATRVFWWGLLWTLVGAILAPIFIGFVVWAVAWLWAFYRIVNGFAKLLADVAYPL